MKSQDFKIGQKVFYKFHDDQPLSEATVLLIDSKGRIELDVSFVGQDGSPYSRFARAKMAHIYPDTPETRTCHEQQIAIMKRHFLERQMACCHQDAIAENEWRDLKKQKESASRVLRKWFAKTPMTEEEKKALKIMCLDWSVLETLIKEKK